MHMELIVPTNRRRLIHWTVLAGLILVSLTDLAIASGEQTLIQRMRSFWPKAGAEVYRMQ
jgi:hypothetical protein